jgi:hypothetical protein
VRNKIFTISLAAVLALSAGLIGCKGEEVPEITEYNLTISSTEGGSVTTPGEGIFTYDEGEVINLIAKPDEGYRFVSWIGDVDTIADVNDATATIAMNDDHTITAQFAVMQYTLIIVSTEGGSVTTPGEGTYTYNYGTVGNLVAISDNGYHFVNWAGDVGEIANVEDATTTITMNDHYTITANFAPGIAVQNWHDLYAIRDNMNGNYILVNDIDTTTAGYEELASPTANGGKGWQRIGTPSNPFTGSLDGQGHEIRDMFITRPEQDYMGLFGYVGDGGVVEDISVVNATVTGRDNVGGLVGWNGGTVSRSNFTGTVTGNEDVGGLVGRNNGLVSNSHSTGNMTGGRFVGGLVGWNGGTVSNSFWDTETSGQAISEGGKGKSTVEMQNINNFSGKGWDIIAVADPGTRNPAYIWNIVDGQTYPFLSWQSVS